MPHGATFPVTASILEPTALLDEARRAYRLPAPLGYHRMYLGVNDTYFLSHADRPLVLRVYRAHARPPARVAFEHTLIDFLADAGVAVARPLRREDGETFGVLSAPEGERVWALFEFAPGEPPTPSCTAAEQYGAALAALHTALDVGAPAANAPTLDLNVLLDEPLARLSAALAHRPADLEFLRDVAALIRTYVQGEAPRLDWGGVHGDFQWKNAHVNDQGVVTIFDFDGAGFGWRAHDLAVFRPLDGDDELWTAFLRGYAQRRAVRAADLAAVPDFEAAIRVWTLGFFLEHRDRTAWGSDAVNEALYDREVARLKRWWPRLTRDAT